MLNLEIKIEDLKFCCKFNLFYSLELGRALGSLPHSDNSSTFLFTLASQEIVINRQDVRHVEVFPFKLKKNLDS